MHRNHRTRPRHGVAAVFAILFVALISCLAVAMAAMTTTNANIAHNQDNVVRARANAESGLRWMGWKFQTVTLPTTTQGIVDNTTAKTLWPLIMANIVTSLADVNSSVLTTKQVSGTTLHIGPVTTAEQTTFELWAYPSPLYPTYAQIIEVKSLGTSGSAKRAMTMQFLIQKSMRYGVLTKIPIQLGKNTVVEGDVYMAAPPKSGQAPVLSISDFRYTSATLSDALTSKIQAFQNFLKGSSGGQPNYTGADNRLDASDTALINRLRSSNSFLAGITDCNQDGFIDEYDIFLQHFDTSGDGRVSSSEYNSAAPKDPNLFLNIDKGIGKPVNSMDAIRPGYSDGYADSLDPYAKVRGTVKIWESRADLEARMGQPATDFLQGPIISRDGFATPVVFGAQDANDPATQITPGSFNMAAFLALAGSSGGTPARPSQLPNPDASALYANTNVSSTDANGTTSSSLASTLTANGDKNLTYTAKTINGQAVQVLTSVTENVPYGSSSPRSTVTRKVFSGVNFKNVVINRGTNALFVNCTFDGVTFVDGAYTMAQSTSDYSKGNNLRFESCTFTGPIAQGDTQATGNNRAAAPTNYTDYTNSWEFTGATVFDLARPSKDGSADSAALSQIKEQATIMAPQTNIEMGSFTAPGQATCSFQGIVVAGCFDCRGTADIDGTIIVPSTGAGNATLGYFGPNDNATSQGEPDPSMVSGSYGRVHVRFNPYRTLPDGISLPISVLPDISSWHEVIP